MTALSPDNSAGDPMRGLVDSIRSQLEIAEVASFSGEIAVGFCEAAADGRAKWIVLRLNGGRARPVREQTLSLKGSPDKSLGCDLAICASMDQWRKASAKLPGTLLEAIEGAQFVVTGRFAYYVRHLPSVFQILNSVCSAVRISFPPEGSTGTSVPEAMAPSPPQENPGSKRRGLRPASARKSHSD